MNAYIFSYHLDTVIKYRDNTVCTVHYFQASEGHELLSSGV